MARPRKETKREKFDEPDPYAWPDNSGRPGRRVSVEYDEDLIRNLAEHGCTVYEIAHICGFSESHFHELKKTYPDIQKAINEGKAKLHRSLRQKQIEVALEGNPQLLIFLGKAELGQSDKMEIDHNIKAEVEYEVRFGEAIEKNNQASETSPGSSDSSE